MKASCGDSGKSLSAVGRDARSGQRGEEHRAMIAATVEELARLIGTRPACRAVGASPATIYRRRRPPEPRTPKPRPRPAPARAISRLSAVRCSRCSIASGSSTSRRRRPTRRCWTRAPTCARPGRCIGCWPPSMVGCGSGAISSPIRRTRSPSYSPSARTNCSRGTSRNCWGPRGGRSSTCT
jgi:hypothetical protein